MGPKRDCVVPDFHKRILFSDEAHFWLNGYVNKQNCRIWSEANPQVYVETPLHPEKTDCLSLVYADKPQTLDHLEDNIRRVIADIRPQMLEKVIENWTSRLDFIRASRGSPMPEIIFKIKHDLAASKATDHDVGDEIETNSANPQTLVVENQHINLLQKNQNISKEACLSIKSRPNSPVASTSKDGIIRCPVCEEEYCDLPTEEWIQCCKWPRVVARGKFQL
ncbi:hypothetical protein TNCV_1417371 [Trichonephila clavipes]|nr:hypothetical protein TNCV_1417371 [Trichonephila clavipes]